MEYLSRNVKRKQIIPVNYKTLDTLSRLLLEGIGTLASPLHGNVAYNGWEWEYWECMLWQGQE